MEVTITARHCTLTDGIRDRMSRRIRRLSRLDPRATHARAAFEQDGRLRRVEARLDVTGGPPLVARAEGPTFRSALDQALDRLERQLKRRRQRRRRLRIAAGRQT